MGHNFGFGGFGLPKITTYKQDPQKHIPAQFHVAWVIMYVDPALCSVHESNNQKKIKNKKFRTTVKLYNSLMSRDQTLIDSI